MKHIKRLIITLATLAICHLTVHAQVQVPTAPTTPPTLASIQTQTFQWLTSFDTNQQTWQASRIELWTSVISEQGGVSPILNEIGLSYDIWRPTMNLTNGTSTAVFLDIAERNTGVSGTISSVQGGVGFAYILWDVRLSTGLDLGGNLEKADKQDQFYGEWNFKIQKALGPHWATGLGFFAQFPNNVQGLLAQLTAAF